VRVLLVTAIYPSPERPWWGTFVRTQVEAVREAGVDVDVLHLRGASPKLAYVGAPAAIRRRLARGAHDLVHAHYGLVGIVARMQRRAPLVVSFHGSDLLGDPRADGTIPWPRRLEAAGSRLLTRLVDAVIVQTEEMARRVAAGTPAHVIPHEVDLGRFSPVERREARERLGLERDARYLLFPADPRIGLKGFPIARAVADELRRADPRIELLTVWRESQERFALYLSAADVMLFPSLQEGSPNVVKQAMACNLPLVATAVGDVPARAGCVPGCAVVERTVPAFVGAARELLARGERSSGRAHVRDLDRAAVARRVIGVYEEVLAR
jgi:glycosyltransferase involved in cell wall biosynthesis